MLPPKELNADFLPLQPPPSLLQLRVKMEKLLCVLCWRAPWCRHFVGIKQARSLSLSKCRHCTIFCSFLFFCRLWNMAPSGSVVTALGQKQRHSSRHNISTKCILSVADQGMWMGRRVRWGGLQKWETRRLAAYSFINVQGHRVSDETDSTSTTTTASGTRHRWIALFSFHFISIWFNFIFISGPHSGLSLSLYCLALLLSFFLFFTTTWLAEQGYIIIIFAVSRENNRNWNKSTIESRREGRHANGPKRGRLLCVDDKNKWCWICRHAKGQKRRTRL